MQQNQDNCYFLTRACLRHIGLQYFFFLGKPCILQQDNAKPHTTFIAAACTRSGQFAVQIFDQLKTFSVMKLKIQQWRPRTVKQLQSSVRQEWGNIPPSKVQPLVSSSVPRGCRVLFKEERMLHSGKNGPVHASSEIYCCNQIQHKLIFFSENVFPLANTKVPQKELIKINK